MKKHETQVVFAALVAFLLGAVGPLQAVDDPQPVSFSGDPTSQTLSIQYSNSSGAANLTSVWMDLGNSEDATGTCAVVYLVQSNVMYVMDDGGTGWEGPTQPGSPLFRGNSHCAPRGEFTSVVISGNTLTWNLKLQFHSGFDGSFGAAATKGLYAAAATATANSGWKFLGSYQVLPVPDPDIVFLSPTDGSGTTQTFQITTSGAIPGSISFAVSASSSPANACVVLFDLGRGSGFNHNFYLLGDDGSTWLGPVAEGTAATLSNSQCSFDVSQSSFSYTSPVGIWTFPLLFKPLFAGPHATYAGASYGSVGNPSSYFLYWWWMGEFNTL